MIVISRWVFGSVLIGIGLSLDVGAANAMLHDKMISGLIVHFLAALIWIAGIVIMKQRLGIALVLGLILFPGVGTLGWTVAMVFGSFLRLPKQLWDSEDEQNSTDTLSVIHAVTNAPALLLFDADVQPVVNVLSAADSNVKRAALNLICSEPSAQSAKLARRLLTDSDLDVRALAAITVSRLESRLNGLVKSALAQVEAHPQNPEIHSTLAHLYVECAHENEIDSINRRFYFTKACEAFEKALLLDPTRNADRMDLAKALMSLGDYQKAWGFIRDVLAWDVHDVQAYLLAVEIAFRQGRLELITELAKQARENLPVNNAAQPVIGWWLEQEEVHEDT